MSLSRSNALWALVGILALCLAGEWLWPDGATAPHPVAAQHFGRRGVQAQAMTERDTSGWGDAVLARPLFSISRRPPKEVASAHPDSAPSQARLAGIMITRYGRRAIFAPDGGGKQLILPEGAAVNESTISRIEPHRVTLASGAILAPAFDKTHTGPIATTPPFQPVAASPTGMFPNPGLMNPNFLNPQNGLPNQGQPPNADDANPQAPAAPFLPPVMRGTIIPPRRE